MHLPISSVNFDWLIDNESSFSQHIEPKDIERDNVPMPDQIGTGHYQAWFLSLDMVVYQAEYIFNKSNRSELLPLVKVDAKFNEPTLMIHTLKHGRVIHQDSISNNTLTFGEGNNLFRFAENISVIPIVDTSSDIQMTSLMIGVSTLRNLLGPQLSDALITNLALQYSPSVSVKFVPSYVNNHLQKSLSSQYSPALKKIIAQARILDFLSDLASYYCDTSAATKLKTDDSRVLATAIYNYLITLEGKLPTIESLAIEFGKSARILNYSFQAEYGESIFVFFMNHRLSSAHEAIKNSNIPLKQISMKLGYAHVNHFSAAFKKRFGYSPSTLRR